MMKIPIKNKLKIYFRYTIPWLISDFYFWFSAKNRKKPDFLIIGAHKGGSTSMFQYISQHPDVQMARRKEINFFTKYYHLGMRYYQASFPRKEVEKLTGEATPYYFFHPLVPARVKETLPQIKIILLLRDPVLRAYSHYNMIKAIDPAGSFKVALELEEERISSASKKILENPRYYSMEHQTYSYLSRGLYYKQLTSWLKYFRLEDMLILKSEDFFENTKGELKKVYDFLELSEIYPKDMFPSNSKNYKGLSKADYDRYKLFFVEDQNNLKKLIGDKYQWF